MFPIGNMFIREATDQCAVIPNGNLLTVASIATI